VRILFLCPRSSTAAAQVVAMCEEGQGVAVTESEEQTAMIVKQSVREMFQHPRDVMSWWLLRLLWEACL